MKLFLSILVFLTCLIKCNASDHSFGADFNVIGFKNSRSHLHLEHQISNVTENNWVFIFNPCYRAYLNATHHGEGIVGLRKFNGKFGYGTNFSYSITNHTGALMHHFSPGLELFFNKLQVSLNHYVPLKKERISNTIKYQYPNSLELGFTYSPNLKYQFSVIPNYDMSSMKMGVDSRISVLLNSNYKFELRPFFRPQNKGISIAFGLEWGGSKDRKTQPIKKTNQVIFTKSQKLPKIKPIPITINIPQFPQVVEDKEPKKELNPIEITQPPFDPPTDPLPPDEKPDVIKPKGWPWDGSFFWNNSPS